MVAGWSSRMTGLTAQAARSSRRCYASHASQFSLSQASGIRVSTADFGQPTSSISLVIKAGSRYEPAPGMSHVLKNLVFRGTHKRSGLSLIREAEHLGGVLSSSLSREHLVLTAEFLRGDEGHFAEVLGDVLTSSKFSPHEYAEDVVPQVAAEYEQAVHDPSVLAFDLAHQIAFRKGLGNSLFANPHTAISHEAVVAFAQASFARPSDVVVVGNGVAADSLSELVAEFFISKPANSTSTAPVTPYCSTSYYGGELRVPTTAHGGSTAGHLLLAFRGASQQSPEYTVLQHLLGGESSVKWSQGTAPLSQLSKGATSARPFNLAYSDAGLFGFYVTAPTAQVEGVANAAIAELRRVAGGVDASDVRKAIAKAKFAAAALLERASERTEALGVQVLGTGKATSLEDLYEFLDGVSPAQVSRAAASALESKPTMVAVGDTHQLPYTDALKL